MPIFDQLKNVLRYNGLGLGVVLLTWLIFFIRTISGQYFYFLDDLKIIYYPLEVLYAAAQTNFTLPVWSNLLGFGQPVIAWGQLGFFTPLHVLLRALQIPPISLLQLSVVGYFLIGIISMFAFLRYRRLSVPSAALGAVVFAFSGFMIGHLNHVNFYTASTLLPLLLLAIEALLTKPTLPRTAALAFIAATAALGGQPQIVLYTLIIGTLYGLFRWGILAPQRKLQLLKPTGLVLLAAILFLGLSSFAILPLREFQPLTERGEDLSPIELFEFSYPPTHAITLIIPTFFGDKTNYWGAKNFQELAGYTGLLPLLLASLALFTWQTSRHRSLRLFGISLLVVTFVFALGKYSWLYRWLVEQHILSTLTTPGRFVFFFTVAVAVLAAVGLDDLHSLPTAPRWQRLLALGLGPISVAALFIPFFIALQIEPRYIAQFNYLINNYNYEWLLAGLALVALPLYLALQHFPTLRPISTYGLVALSSITLLAFGWSYNPLVLRSTALAEPSWMNQLRTLPTGRQAEQTSVPPRLYGRDMIYTEALIKNIRSVEAITRDFTIMQPFTPTITNANCVRIMLYAAEIESDEAITVSLKKTVTSSALEHIIVRPSAINHQGYTPVCFSQTLEAHHNYILVLSALKSHINPYLIPATGDGRAYLIRVSNPTADQLERSRKDVRLVTQEGSTETDAGLDPEVGTLSRHLNVIASASSARWIGALSIKPYREFIEDFFQNDQDNLIDGDGQHFLQRHRALFDSAGVTHLTQFVPKETADRLPDLGFTLVGEQVVGNGSFRLYANPQAYPKAYLVSNAISSAAADETRNALSDPAYNPQQTVYISGDQLPQDLSPISKQPLKAVVELTRYENTVVNITVNTPREAWLVVTDSTTPQWRTFIDNQPAPYYIANSLFKAARVPAGQHTVSFRYDSPAIKQAKLLTGISLPLTLLLLIVPGIWPGIRWQSPRSKKKAAV